MTITMESTRKLRSIIGATVPDLRGLFLRGQGGNAAGLGQRQTEGVYLPPISTNLTLFNIQSISVGYLDTDAGNRIIYLPGGSTSFSVQLDSSASETRPVNQAVRYLIRALK